MARSRGLDLLAKNICRMARSQDLDLLAKNILAKNLELKNFCPVCENESGFFCSCKTFGRQTLKRFQF
jgi:hypothetical protein